MTGSSCSNTWLHLEKRQVQVCPVETPTGRWRECTPRPGLKTTLCVRSPYNVCPAADKCTKTQTNKFKIPNKYIYRMLSSLHSPALCVPAPLRMCACTLGTFCSICSILHTANALVANCVQCTLPVSPAQCTFKQYTF